MYGHPRRWQVRRVAQGAACSILHPTLVRDVADGAASGILHPPVVAAYFQKAHGAARAVRYPEGASTAGCDGAHSATRSMRHAHIGDAGNEVAHDGTGAVLNSAARADVARGSMRGVLDALGMDAAPCRQQEQSRPKGKHPAPYCATAALSAMAPAMPWCVAALSLFMVQHEPFWPCMQAPPPISPCMAHASPRMAPGPHFPVPQPEPHTRPKMKPSTRKRRLKRRILAQLLLMVEVLKRRR